MTSERLIDIGLRVGGETDIAALQSISGEARVRYRTIPELAFVADAPPLGSERFEACRMLVAFDRGSDASIGFVLTRTLDGLLYLDNISVASAASDQGVGEALLAETYDHARTENLPAVALTTFRSPQWNGPWFRRAGFVYMPPERIGRCDTVSYLPRYGSQAMPSLSPSMISR